MTLRFRADNPGVWFFHCHVGRLKRSGPDVEADVLPQIDWHLSSGLALTFISSPEQMQQKLTLPQALLDQCAAQGVATSGNVVGTQSTTDFKGQPWGPWPLKLVRPVLSSIRLKCSSLASAGVDRSR